MAWIALAGCNTGLSVEELRDPANCVDCHPDHVREWSGSMHAYASEDPVFVALNALGQEETDGELGDFCVACHAPTAVALGLTTDGLNLDEIPDHLKGVTCYTCHQVEAVEGDHNNPLRFALDSVLRGGIFDPTPNRAHDSAYSVLQDRTESESSDMCGSCHDIVTPLGAHIERTYLEWQESIFVDGLVGLNCGECHMVGRDGVAAEADDVPLRRIHDHRFPGVDIAITDFPEREDQRAAVQEFLDDSLFARLCVQPSDGETLPIVVTLDNVGAGHSFPSGATSDRRVWVELQAFAGDELVWTSGAIGDQESVKDHLADDANPTPWTLYTDMLDSDGEQTHKFWEAADIDYDGRLLSAHTTLDPTDPAYIETLQTRTFAARGAGIDRVRMAVKIRPLPLDLVDELIEDGRLDPAVKAELPTFTLQPTIQEWTPEVPVNSGNLSCVPDAI